MQQRKQHYKNLFRHGCAAILLLLATLLPDSAKCAITLDTISTRAVSASAANWTHVTRSGSNRILIITVVINSGGITSVLYNGTALTLFGTRTRNNMVTAMYYMVSPPVGPLTASVNVSGGATNIRAGAVTYFGVNQSVPLQDLMTTDNNTSNPTVTYTSDPGLAVVLMGARTNPTPVSQVQVYEQGNTQFNNLSSVATLGSTGLSYTLATSDWAIVAGLLNPIVVLPVQFGPLKASKQPQQIALNWNMYDLKGIQSIAVERSTDGKHFVKAGNIELPTISSTVEFHYFDQNAPKQRLYYRIVLTDHSGKSEYSSLTSINNSGANITLTVYPNPSTGIVNIRSGEVITKVTLLNVSGQTLSVCHYSEYTVSQIDISCLEKGIYFLHIEDEDGNISREKIQKI